MTEISDEIKIKAAPDRVYRALTEIDGLKSWHTGQVEGTADVGGVIASARRFGEFSCTTCGNMSRPVNPRLALNSRRIETRGASPNAATIAVRLCFRDGGRGHARPVTKEKRVDELPGVMEDHPTTAVLVEKVTGCEFSFLANAYSNQDQYAWAMGCKKAETGMKMVEASRGRIAPVVVDTAPCKEVILTGEDVDMTILPMFLHHERDGQSYSDDNLVISKDPDTGVYDWGFYRSMFRAKNERGFDMTCTSHRSRINATLRRPNRQRYF
jgi:hypothetical protein